MPLAVLEEMGLTRREAEVYELLLRLGESPVSDILKELQAHSQLIYRAIDGLHDKGLVTITTRRHRKYVRAEDPRILKQREEQKLQSFNQALPELLSLQTSSKDAIVRVAKGNEAVRSTRIRSIEELTSNGCQYVIGASGDRYYQILGDLYLEVERKRVKKGIPKRLITFESQREIINKNDTIRELTEFRFLPEDRAIPTTTNIFNDTVALFIWNEDPIVITIESAEAAESYRHYFETLWKVAKN